MLARIEASPVLFDLGGAVRALVRIFSLIDDVAVSVIEGGCMRVFTQHDWSASGAEYRLEDYPASHHSLVTGELVAIRVDDPGADQAEVRLLREIRFGSLLLVPVLEDDGSPVALLELYARDAREGAPRAQGRPGDGGSGPARARAYRRVEHAAPPGTSRDPGAA